MTISTTASRISYNGNGATTAFSFPYRFLTNADLVVIKVAADGTETTLTLNTNYTVTGADDDAGGTVTLSVAPLSGQRVVIYRAVTITQEVDYITGDPFPAETHERALDRLTMIVQQQQDAIDRSAKLPVTSTEDADALIADILRLADSADNIDTLAGIESDITDVAAIDSNVTTVAGIAANVTSVAGNATNINTVAGISSDVTTVAGIDADVTTVAGIDADVTAVAGNEADISTVADNIADVNTAATNIAAIIDAPNQATAASNSAIAAAASAAAAAASYDSFDDRYLGSKTSDPTVDNDGNPLVTGALYYSSTEQAMKVYDGATWILASSAGAASMNVFKFVATAGQTTFTGAASVGGTLSYTAGNIIVFMNGAALDAADYTASNGTSIVLGAAASLNDELVIVAFESFTVADTYSISGADAEFLRKAGEDGVTVTGGNVGIGTLSPTTGVRADIVSDSTAQQYVNVLKVKTSNTGDYHPAILFENNRNSVANAVKISIDSSTAAGSGELVVSTKDSGGTFNSRLIVRNNGDFAMNSGYGSVATAYGCRAWVNFNGTGTVAIRGNGNVSSITDNGTGDYTANFTTGMPDANYSALLSTKLGNNEEIFTIATGSCRVKTTNGSFSPTDSEIVCLSIFR